MKQPYENGAFHLQFCDLNSTMYVVATKAEYSYSAEIKLCFNGKMFVVEAPNKELNWEEN